MGRKEKGPKAQVAHDSPITLAAQVGDKRADDATASYHAQLRRVLRESCSRSYSGGIDEFSFVLRIDGDIWHWDFEGADKLRLSRKGRYITVDIGVPRSRWEGRDDREIREYLARCLDEGLGQMVAKLRSAKIDLDEEALLADFGEGLRRFQGD